MHPRLPAALALAIVVGCRPRPSEIPGSGPFAPAFETRREHAIPGKPTAVLACDLDGDALPEIVATDAERGELRVWKGAVGPVVGAGRVVPVGGWPLEPVALPAARGIRPVAVASRSQRELAAFDLMAKEPGIALWRVELPATPRAIAAGDLGPDEALDVAVVCDGGRLAIVGLQGALREVAIPDGLPRCALVLADGSGVVLGYQDRRSLVVADSNSTHHEIRLGGIPRDLLETDLDHDGDLELAVAGGDASIWVLGFNEPGGSKAWSGEAGTAPLEWHAGTIPIDLAAADLDGERGDELVWLAFHDLAWTAAGRFTKSGPGWRKTGYAGQTPCALALLDRDADRRLDLVTANRDSQSIGLARGLGAEGFAAPRKLAVGRFPTAVLAGDLDRDSRPDLVVLESKDETAAVLVNQGEDLSRTLVLATGPDPRAACLSDFDRDGHLDLALVADDPQGSRVRLWFGDGAGALAGRAGIEGPRAGRGVRAMIAADLDGDGRVDLLAADRERNAIEWWRNRASAAAQVEFESPRSIQVANGPCALAPIEVDGDPSPEIAVALGGPGPRTGVVLLDLSGAGGLELRELASIETGGSPCALAAARLDENAHADLAVVVLQSAGSSVGEARCYVRDPNASVPAFRLAGSFATSAHPRAIAAADFDGDGLDELVIPAQYAHRVDFASPRRAGGGQPWRIEVQDALGAGIGCMDAVIADLNGDGKLDVAVANGHTDDVTILFATGR
ncbi:MAG: FG-GAP repeat domain-containing protein [Planctomycetota bacterium]